MYIYWYNVCDTWHQENILMPSVMLSVTDIVPIVMNHFEHMLEIEWNIVQLLPGYFLLLSLNDMIV